VTLLLGLGAWLGLLVITGLAAWRSAAGRADALRRACHELRGPLAAARLGLELEGRRRGASRSRLRAIDRELRRAALAVEELDRREGSRGGVEWRWEELDVRELLGDSVEAWRATAAQRGCELALSWSGPPALVRADPVRLAQAVGNLLANAIEHGGGRIEARGRAEGAEVRIEVADEGPGLAAPLDELARRARRARRDRGRRGHGLAVATAAVAAHGGRLACAPSERGARLVLALPAIQVLPETIGS